jgi:hypothetical protein
LARAENEKRKAALAQRQTRRKSTQVDNRRHLQATHFNKIHQLPSNGPASLSDAIADAPTMEAAEAVEGDVQVLLAFYHVHEQSYATRHKVEKVLRAYQRKARKKASKDGVECDWRDLMYAAIASQRGEDPRVHWERAASDGVVAATETTSDDSRQHHRTPDVFSVANTNRASLQTVAQQTAAAARQRLGAAHAEWGDLDNVSTNHQSSDQVNGETLMPGLESETAMTGSADEASQQMGALLEPPEREEFEQQEARVMSSTMLAAASKFLLMNVTSRLV